MYTHVHEHTYPPPHTHTHRERERELEFIHVLVCYHLFIVTIVSCCWTEYDNKFPKLRRRDAPKPTLVSNSHNGENSTIVVYDFTYGNNQYQQTEVKHSLLCPWCVYRCRFKEIHPLLLHLKLDHSVFTFSYMVR